MKKGGTFVMGVFGWVFTLLCSAIIIGCIAVVLLFNYYARDLPEYSQLAQYDPPTVTRLYAGDGRLLAEYATEKRSFVPLSAIPKRVQQAFISAEDKNFYKHTGVDITGIARAIYTNILNYGHNRSLVGGSTITQQVVKNFLLTNEKSLERKIKEAILALRISQVYSKDKILELYLNEIYLGLRSYGIAVAALNYFNKSLDELTLEEAALLAAMPKGPALYDPRRNYEDAKARRDWVLERMREDGYISEEEEETAAAMPITLKNRDPEDVVSAEFFAEEVRRWLAEKYGASVLYEGGLVVKTTLDPHLQKLADKALRKALIEYDRRRGYRGPVKHLASMDGWRDQLKELIKDAYYLLDTQSLAIVTEMTDKKAIIGFADGRTGDIPYPLLKWTRRIIKDGVLGPAVNKPADIFKVGDVVIVGPLSEEQEKLLAKDAEKTAWDLQQVPAVNGALVAIDPHTGRVLALSGGYMYGKSEFNRATQAMRQPGSAFKPFVYLAGLENGYTPSTIIMDAPVELSQGSGMPAWKPQNYGDDYLGPTTLRVGLEKSRNTMTVRLAQVIGISRILEMGKRLGIYDNPARNFSIVLGSGETTLLKLANAYASIVNGGKKVQPSLIERIDDRQGKTIYRRDQRPCTGCQVFDMDMLPPASPPPQLPDSREQVLDPRLAYQMTSLLEGVVQRGTATRARALNRPLGGKTGTTNDSRDTWFMGFSPDLVTGVFIGYDQPKTLGKKETGSSVALPGFMYFMEAALKDEPAKPFRIPPGIQLIRVDLETGYPVTPGFETGPVIQEAFVAGDPIFRPASAPGPSADIPWANMPSGEPVVMQPPQPAPAPLPWRQEAPSDIPPPAVIPPPAATEPALHPYPTEIPQYRLPPEPDSGLDQPTLPAEGTGGLY